MIRIVLNVLWVLLGGLLMALGWLLASAIMVVTIVGIPWARAAFNLASFTLWPFGRDALDRRVATGETDIGTGCLGTAGNVLWFLFAGWWLFLGHLTSAMLNAVTIIGIPFAVQHLKIGIAALAPVGKQIVALPR